MSERLRIVLVGPITMEDLACRITTSLLDMSHATGVRQAGASTAMRKLMRSHPCFSAESRAA